MDRYAQLNFAAWSEHKTVECRLLPMFRKQSLGVAAVVELLTIFEDYLAQDFEGKFHEEKVMLPKPQVTPTRVKQEYDLPNFAPVRIAKTIEVNELPPVGKGMRRVALPTGKAMPNKTSTNLGTFLLQKVT